MKLYIFKEDDRLAVAPILVKNGYIVSQDKEKKTPTSKSYVYYLEAERKQEEVKSE